MWVRHCHSPDPSDKRGLTLNVWYPTEARGTASASYMPNLASCAGAVSAATEDQFMAVRQSADPFYSQDLAFVRTLLTRINTEDTVLRGTVRLDAVFGARHSSGFGSVMSAYAPRSPGLQRLISFDADVSGIGRARGVDVPLFLARARPTAPRRAPA